MTTIVQFSPTGNTAYIANQFKDALDADNVYALEHTDPTTLSKSEHLLILFSVHAFNAPTTVKRFVNNLPKGLFKNVSLIAVGCNTGWVNKAATTSIKKILEQKGYNICVDDVIAMPLTFIMSFPEDLIKEQLIEANHKITLLSEDIKSTVKYKKTLPFKSILVNRLGKAEPFAVRFFGLELHAKKSCNQCGICVRECPEKNIKMTDEGKLKFGFKCMMCMRCLYNCPTKSITPRISKFIPVKGGYSLDKHLILGVKNESK